MGNLVAPLSLSTSSGPLFALDELGLHFQVAVLARSFVHLIANILKQVSCPEPRPTWPVEGGSQGKGAAPYLAYRKRKRRKVAVFGNFGSSNFGNEVTFEVFLHHLRRLLPDAEVVCICPNPDAIAATHGVEAVAISRAIDKPRSLHSPLARWFRKVFIGVPSELYRWLDAFRTLERADVLFIPGTGLLTDAWGMPSWGPYNVFKWSLVARLRGCKVRFVSVGAGPLGGALGRYLVKSALSLADFRSYRDQSSMKFLEGIGFRGPRDGV
jgi:hypothetical protein